MRGGARKHHRQERGAAILAAMVTVTLVATLAASAVMHQWTLVEVESAERSRVQAQWLLRGAVDWSRLLLRQDQQSSANSDHLAEPWAVPLEETKLSMFLAAHNGVNDGEATADMTEAFMSGEMHDQQAKLNALNMVMDASGRHDEIFQRLFDRLGLPSIDLVLLKDGLQRAYNVQLKDERPLKPQTLQDVQWLGLQPSTINALEPYVTLLPWVTAINVNTAPALVIWAVAEEMEWSKAQMVVARRAQSHFTSLKDVQSVTGGALLSEKYASVRSQNFQAVGRVRVGNTGIGMQADLRRVNGVINVQRIQTFHNPVALN